MAAAEMQLVLDLWEAVRDAMPVGKRADAAIGMLTALATYGIEASDLGDLVDEDDDLADAYREVFTEDEDDADEQEEWEDE